MKKTFMIVLALVISVAFMTTVFAQTPKAAPEKPAVAAEKATAEKPAKAEKKDMAKTFTGEVVSADAAAKTVVAKDKKGEMTFDVSAVKEFKAEAWKAGDKVVVKYAEKDGKMVASSVKKAVVKKAEKKDEKPAEKPAPEKTAAPAPAKK